MPACLDLQRSGRIELRNGRDDIAVVPDIELETGIAVDEADREPNGVVAKDDVTQQLRCGRAGREGDVELDVGADDPGEQPWFEVVGEPVAAADREATLLGRRRRPRDRCLERDVGLRSGRRAEVQEVAIQELMLEGWTPHPHLRLPFGEHWPRPNTALPPPGSGAILHVVAAIWKELPSHTIAQLR